jgi:hypothetical protein
MAAIKTRPNNKLPPNPKSAFQRDDRRMIGGASRLPCISSRPRARAAFRLPLGPSRAEQHHTTSFGITVKGEFARPAYEREREADVISANVDLMNFRFGKNGKVSGF